MFKKTYDLEFQNELRKLPAEKEEVLEEAIQKGLIPKIEFIMKEIPSTEMDALGILPTSEILKKSPLKVRALK